MGHGRRHAADHRVGRPGSQLRRRAAPAGTRRSAGRQPQGLCPDGAPAVAVLAGQRQAHRRLTPADGLSGHASTPAAPRRAFVFLGPHAGAPRVRLRLIPRRAMILVKAAPPCAHQNESMRHAMCARIQPQESQHVSRVPRTDHRPQNAGRPLCAAVPPPQYARPGNP
ncbi:protein of unknown function [Cupriavidus taiwanensis]|uniref:Uncharacterized protein n=1 Tax=Cupriavidus taiwanensis TaxID=164546 RepID=A0A9Q7UT66_9BURK|nr:protein of unknown function [Cupriavidus taiwanensis]